MKKYITKRNITQVLGLIGLALAYAIDSGLIVAPEAVKYATLVIGLIGYITNDTIVSQRYNKIFGERSVNDDNTN